MTDEENEIDPVDQVVVDSVSEPAKLELKEADVQMKNVSDDDLFLCLNEGHEVGSVSKGKGGSSVGSVQTASKSFGAISVPWMTIATMIAKLGLPLAKPSLEKLKARLVQANWPNWIKAPLLAAIEVLLTDDTLFETFMRSVAVNGTINS